MSTMSEVKYHTLLAVSVGAYFAICLALLLVVL